MILGGGGLQVWQSTDLTDQQRLVPPENACG